MDEINSVCGDGMSESKEEYKDPINLEGQQLVVWATYESKKPHKFKVCRKFQFAVVWSQTKYCNNVYLGRETRNCMPSDHR